MVYIYNLTSADAWYLFTYMWIMHYAIAEKSKYINLSKVLFEELMKILVSTIHLPNILTFWSPI